MAWMYLLFAGFFEICWPVGLKLSQDPKKFYLGLTIALLGLGSSGFMLWMAQKTIPMSIAYAVWTGIGAAGTFFVGVYFFNDQVNWIQTLSAFLIIAGVFGLRLG